MTKNSEPASWEFIRRDKIGDYRIFSLFEEFYQAAGLNLGHGYYVLEAPDWVNVVPITPDGNVVLIRQFRVGTAEVTLEIPGGMVDPGEQPEMAVLRELEEETGYRSDSLVLLGSVKPNPAFLRNTCHMYLALGATPTGQINFDPGEDVQTVEVPSSEILGMIADGRISHSLVLNALLLAEQRGWTP